MRLATPAVDTLTLISSLIIFTDDSAKSIKEALELVEQALDCFKFPDYVVMTSPTLYSYELVYDVAVQVLPGSSYVSFKVIFQVRP